MPTEVNLVCGYHDLTVRPGDSPWGVDNAPGLLVPEFRHR
jgi:hypothetical protein